MASSGGPRASGSGRADEGKFRQRVDTHYRVMADAKKQISQAGRLTIASAIGFVSMAGVAAMQHSHAIAAGAVAFAFVSAAVGRTAMAAAGSRDAKKNALAYRNFARTLGLVLTSAGPAIMLLGLPSLVILAGLAVAWMLGIVASARGYFGAVTLLDAFKQQELKAQKR